MNPKAYQLPPAGEGGRSVAQQALQAQTALLPYALAVFGVCLPIYVWIGSFTFHPAEMIGSFAIFAIAWGCFYAAVNWIRTADEADVARRGRIHILCALAWVGAIAQITVLAQNSGPARDIILLLAVGAAAICIFFTVPWLPSLLIIAPCAAAPPLLALALAGDRSGFNIAWGGLALSMALALSLNRLMRRQFALAADRETLIQDRARSQAETQRLARSKSDLVATLSHEIRNGLTGVAHVLAGASGRTVRAAPSREQLSAALDATNDLIAVLNTTLDSETAEAGRLSVETTAFDPLPLVEHLILLNRPQAAAKGLEMSLHVASELASIEGGGVLADAVRTRQILGNLVANALKYTVRGRIEVRVDLVDDQRRLAIEVADTGPGLTPEEMVQAFEPFTRIARTGVGVPGAGLGLSLSRQLARLMRGEVSCHGAPGVGACFRLELPYDAAALLREDHVVEPSIADGPPGAAGAPLRILVVESDGLSAAMLRALLEQLGHQVVHAIDGARAAELARVCEFDLITVDSRLADPDPVGSIERLRALPQLSGPPPIVAVIGDGEEAQACLSAGAATVVRRPVGMSSVARAVAEALSPVPVQPAVAVA